MLLKHRLCSQKEWRCEVEASHQFSECNPALCPVCEAPLFRFLIWHLRATCFFLEFDANASHHAVVVLLVLVATLVLPVASLLKLEWQGAKICANQCSCKVAGSGQAPLFWFLIWHFRTTCIFLEFNANASHHAVVVLLVLVATLVLPVASLLKLEWQGAKICANQCSCKVVGSGQAPLFRFLIWHFRTTCIFLEFGANASHHAVVVLLVLVAT